MEKRYYYKSEDGRAYYNFKSPSSDDGLIEITKEEYDAVPKDYEELLEFLKQA